MTHITRMRNKGGYYRPFRDERNKHNKQVHNIWDKPGKMYRFLQRWTLCHTLNVCLPCKSICWNQNPQCHGARRWWSGGGWGRHQVRKADVGACSPSLLSAMRGHSEKTPTYQWGWGPHRTGTSPDAGSQNQPTSMFLAEAARSVSVSYSGLSRLRYLLNWLNFKIWNGYLTNKKIQLFIKKVPTKKSSGPESFACKFHKLFKEGFTQKSSQTLPVNRRRNFSTYSGSIVLTR